MTTPPSWQPPIGPEWPHEFFASPDALVLGGFPDEDTSRQEAEQVAALIGLRAGMVVADIPCGPGRHLVHWARRGCCAVGLDASPYMLRAAAATAERYAVHVHLVRGLMERLPFGREVFDVVVNLFNSFGYLPDDAANQRVITEAARCLKRGGLFLLDTRNPVAQILCAPLDDWVLLPQGRLLRVTATYLRATKRLEVQWIEADRGQRVYAASLRLYNLEELKGMFARAGLRLEAVYGDFAGTTFAGHLQMILLGRKG
jgi:SAM-dependent methyltransferase